MVWGAILRTPSTHDSFIAIYASTAASPHEEKIQFYQEIGDTVCENSLEVPKRHPPKGHPQNLLEFYVNFLNLTRMLLEFYLNFTRILLEFHWNFT